MAVESGTNYVNVCHETVSICETPRHCVSPRSFRLPCKALLTVRAQLKQEFY